MGGASDGSLEASRDKRSSLKGAAINQSVRSALDICQGPLVGFTGSVSLHNDGWHSLSGAGLRNARTRLTSGRFSLDAGFPWRFQSATQLCSLVDSIPGSACVVRCEGCLKWEPGIQSVALSGWAVGHSCLHVFRKHTCARIFTCARAAQAWCLARFCDVAGGQRARSVTLQSRKGELCAATCKEQQLAAKTSSVHSLEPRDLPGLCPEWMGHRP